MPPASRGRTAPRGPVHSSRVPGLLSAWPTMLVAAYALAAFSWSMPETLFPPKPWIDRAAAGPFLTLGLWQSWDMFSPDPRNADICVEIIVTDRDGRTERRMLTDMVAMGFFERWQKDRWRKYFNDHLRLDAESGLWQPFAEYAARRLRAEGYDPATVELVRWWRVCEPRVRPGLRAEQRETPWQSHLFHRWSVPREPSR